MRCHGCICSLQHDKWIFLSLTGWLVLAAASALAAGEAVLSAGAVTVAGSVAALAASAVTTTASVAALAASAVTVAASVAAFAASGCQQMAGWPSYLLLSSV